MALNQNMTPHRINVNYKKLEDILRYFEERKVQARVVNYKNKHIVVTGAVRVVNFYASTSTITCDPCDKFKPFKLLGAKHETAMKRVVDIANIGY